MANRIYSAKFKLLIALLSLALAGPLLAQHSLHGTVSDRQGQSLGYATVALLNPSDSILIYFGVTDSKGAFRIRNIKKGDYLLQYSFVGMETLYKNISVPASDGEDLGTQVLSPNALEEVTIIEEYVPITFRSDTVEFNSNAFNTKSHAVVEDLLKKIPGIEVDEVGNMKALGEDVVNVRVDGKEFFGKDPKVATRNLPADAIEKVQVYDKKSDESEFTGVDDGVRERTINLLLNEDHKKGYFGNLEAGFGSGTSYKADGKLYRFSEKLQSALLGMANNINEFGYTGNHGKEFGTGVKGENQSMAGGLNLSYNTEGSNRYFLSYLASSNLKNLNEETSTENYLPAGSYHQQSAISEEERNTPHKINLGVRHKFNERHNLILDGDLNISSNKLESEGLTHTGFADALINTQNNTTITSSSVIDAEAKGSYVFKFNEGRTQFSTKLLGYYYEDNSLLNWRDTISLYNPDSMDLYLQFRDEKSHRKGWEVSPGIVQRIKQFWYISAKLEVGVLHEKMNRRQTLESEGSVLVDTMYHPFGTQHLWAGPMLSLKRNSNKTQLEFILKGSAMRFDKELDGSSLGLNTYYYFQPGFNYEYKYRTGRRVNVRYSTHVNMPSVNQLYPMLNTLNLLSIYQGNLDLNPEYSHNVSASWWYFDQFSFTSLFARIGGSYVKNKIGWSQSTNEQLITLISPVNTPDQRSAYSYVSFSTPIRRLGVKVSLTWHESWNKGLSIINDENNTQSNFIHSLGLRFENRKKEKWDAALGGNVSITDARYSISTMNTAYYNTSMNIDIRFTPSEKWSFETQASIVNYNSKSFNEAISIPLLSAGISYYFLRGERASLTLRGYDMLNRQVGFEQISRDNYLMQQEWNTIGRYVMLEFHMRIGR